MKNTQIENLIKQLRFKVSAETRDRILNNILLTRKVGSTCGEPCRTKPHHPNIWNIIMRSPITKLAAAAAIIIAVIIGIHRFNVKVDGASTAWASVMQNVYQATTVSYEQTIDEGGHKITSKVMVNRSGVIRHDTEKGILFLDFPNGIQVELDPNSKRAYITHRLGSPTLGKPFNVLKNLTICSDRGKFAGKQKIDGKPADMFVVEEPFLKITIWIDIATCLPVRYERVHIPNPNKDIIMPHMSLRFKDFGGDTNNTRELGMGGGMGIIDKPTTITQSSFQWNIELDESLFNLTPPQDYTVEEKQSDDSEPDRKDLIEAFAFWTEMSDGFFPDEINDLGDPNKVKPLLIKKYYKGISPKEEFDLAYKEMNTILKALMFAQVQKTRDTWEYVGQGVKIGEANTPVCWWKPEKSKTWRILYADLSIDDVNEVDLPETK